MYKLKKRKIDLIFERIPPLSSWIIITLPLWGGIFFPEFTAYFVLFCNIYFLYKSAFLVVNLLISIIRIRQNENINWFQRLKELDNVDSYINIVYKRIADLNMHTNGVEIKTSANKDKLNKIIFERIPGIIRNILYKIEKSKVRMFLKNDLRRLKNIKKITLNYDWHKLKFVVIIPHWKEPYSVLEDTILKLKNSNYFVENIYIVLASEDRDPEGYEKSMQLKKKYEKYFGKFWITRHVLTENEIIGKSSNMAHASRFVAAEIQKMDLNLKNVIVTSCDCDSQLPENYFANVAYLYVTEPDSEYKYYTGAIMFYANIWRVPFYVRVKNSMGTIYNVGRLIRTDTLVPFSTYSLSLWLLSEIGFWSADITPEDFHTFYKGMFKYPQKVSTVPIFQKILSDAAEGSNTIDTIKNNYFQERRWAWGVSDDGWLLKQLVKSLYYRRTSIRAIYMSLNTVINHVSSVGFAFLVAIGGTITLKVNPGFANTVLGFNLPIISSLIINLTLYLLIISILLDFFLKPAPQGKITLGRRIIMIIEWITQPITGIFLVALPGIEAHTRLLFGRYLDYYLTKKK